jgi:phage-related protein
MTMELKPRFRVVLYREADEFLKRIDAKASLKIKENIHKVSLGLDPALLKKLTGEIWEFRALYFGKHYRMLAFWDKRDGKDTLVVATHGFIKKVSKVPQKEIDKAKDIMKAYFKNK